MQTYLLFILFFFIWRILPAQYASELIEYRPAPGQHINTSAGNMTAAASVTGNTNGLVSLGGFGGYIVLGFSDPVKNDPDNPYGIDFTIFGNAGHDWSEPAVVYVMKDENRNGLPDDTWYLLAGSDYFSLNTIKSCTVSYFNPETDYASDVPWKNNLGNEGYIPANSFKSQSYYPNALNFPDIPQDEYKLVSVLIQADIDMDDPFYIKSYPKSFGYADNYPRGNMESNLPDNPYTSDQEGHGGDPMDISWAIDISGNYVHLDEISFIKIQTAVNDLAGYLGELSSEICGVMDVSPDPAVNGITEKILIDGCPRVLKPGKYQLKGLLFQYGQLTDTEELSWEVQGESARISESGLLDVNSPGEFTVRVSLENKPEIYDEIDSRAIVETSASVHRDDPEIINDPANGIITVKGIAEANFKLLDMTGKIILQRTGCKAEEIVHVNHLRRGIYILQVFRNFQTISMKVFIR